MLCERCMQLKRNSILYASKITSQVSQADIWSEKGKKKKKKTKKKKKKIIEQKLKKKKKKKKTRNKEKKLIGQNFKKKKKTTTLVWTFFWLTFRICDWKCSTHSYILQTYRYISLLFVVKPYQCVVWTLPFSLIWNLVFCQKQKETFHWSVWLQISTRAWKICLDVICHVVFGPEKVYIFFWETDADKHPYPAGWTENFCALDWYYCRQVRKRNGKESKTKPRNKNKNKKIALFCTKNLFDEITRQSEIHVHRDYSVSFVTAEGWNNTYPSRNESAGCLMDTLSRWTGRFTWDNCSLVLQNVVINRARKERLNFALEIRRNDSLERTTHLEMREPDCVQNRAEPCFYLCKMCGSVTFHWFLFCLFRTK